MKKRWFLLFAFMVAFVPLAACSRRPVPAEVINVVMTDYEYAPKEMIIPSGKEITLNITNKGAVEHEFVIMKYGTSIGDSFGSEDEENIYWEIEVKPGETTTVTFTAPEQIGKYQLICGILGHYNAGMEGTVQVVMP
ncbi:MAG: cupredoxin domain-containing protein [Chloroflexus sp.]|nr:cupredoxin domain-containing protein [Chloroflexus sp.]